MHTEFRVRAGMTLDELIAAVGPEPCAVLATDTLLPDIDDSPPTRKAGAEPKAHGHRQVSAASSAELRAAGR